MVRKELRHIPSACALTYRLEHIRQLTGTSPADPYTAAPCRPQRSTPGCSAGRKRRYDLPASSRVAQASAKYRSHT